MVGSSDAKLRIFPFHPESPSYDPNEWSATGAPPLLTIQITNNYPVNSTPVILPDERILVQTQHSIDCWQISNDFGWGAFLDWRFFPTGGALSDSSSVKVYKQVCSSSPIHKAIAIANDSLYAIDLDTGAGGKLATLAVDDFYEHNSTPAIGYRADDECGQFIYAAHRLGPEPVEEVPHFFAIDPAITPSGSDPTNTIVWRHPITRPDSFPGTLASPSVIDAGPVIIPADDGYLYEFYHNGAQDVDDPPVLLTEQQEPLPDEQIETYLSGTAALGPNGEIIFWGENLPNIHMFIFGENNEAATPIETAGIGSWVHGAPALALFDIDNVVRGRLIVNTPGNPNSADGCKVFEVRLSAV
ncbi:MAG: hypothetical protein JNG88_18460, partial [Phycisphaerales bacterium]|nr:hypothetical protein [Phycisphaerales bacterium]